MVPSGHISPMQVFGSGRKQDFAMCLEGSELQNSQQEENPQLHILVPCSHLSDGVINNAFESFESALLLGGGVHGKFPWSVSVEMNPNAKVTTILRFFSPKVTPWEIPASSHRHHPWRVRGALKADLLFEPTPPEK